MKKLSLFLFLFMGSVSIMAQTLSPGQIISDTYLGNKIAYYITSVNEVEKKATAMLWTNGTDLGSAEKTLTIPESFSYDGYTVTPTSMESDNYLTQAKYGAIVFNSSITETGVRAFRNARNLTSVDLKNITKLGWGSFDESPISSVDLTNITYMGDMCFRNAAITSLHIPAATNINFYGSFGRCPNLKTITVEAGNPYCKVVDGMLVSDSGTTLYVINWGSNDSLIVPACVTDMVHSLWGGLDKDIYIPSASKVNLGGVCEQCLTRVHVPCSMIDTYTADTKWKSINLVGMYEGTVAVDYDSEKGDVQILGTVDCERAVAQATAKSGNRFVRWSDGTRDVIDTISIASPATPLFLSDGQVWMETSSFDGAFGTVTPVASVYGTGTVVNITATPQSGYHFVQWSDGSSEVTRSVVLSKDTFLVAFFDIDVPVVATITSDDETMGSVTGGGTFRQGEVITITATPNNEKYAFVQWSDGSTSNPRNITLEGDTAISASFVRLLSVGDMITHTYDGNKIGYQITAINRSLHTATAMLITNNTDLGSAEKTLTIPENFTYEDYTVTPTSMENDNYLTHAKYGAIVFNSSITETGVRAFRNARNLTSVDLKNITKLGWGSFDESPLTSIDLTNVTTVGDQVCTYSAITSLHIPATTYINFYGSFTSCPNLKTITVEEGNPYCKVVDGMLVSIDSTILYVINWGSTDRHVVPNCVTNVRHALWGGLDKDIYIPYASMVNFDGVYQSSNTHVHVPCNLLDDYAANSHWADFDLSGELLNNITVNATNGMVILSDTTDCAKVRLTAVPNEGYVFIKWSDNSEINPRTITVDRDTVLTAVFCEVVSHVNLTLDDQYLPVAGEVIPDIRSAISLPIPMATPSAYITWTDGATGKVAEPNHTYQVYLYAPIAEGYKYDASLNITLNGQVPSSLETYTGYVMSAKFDFTVPALPTAIDENDNDNNNRKVIENGQIVIIKNGVKYNALGQIIK